MQSAKLKVVRLDFIIKYCGSTAIKGIRTGVLDLVDEVWRVKKKKTRRNFGWVC